MAPQTRRTSSHASNSPVNWRLFDQTVGEVREAFAHVPDEELESVIHEAVTTVRREKQSKRQREKR